MGLLLAPRPHAATVPAAPKGVFQGSMTIGRQVVLRSPKPQQPWLESEGGPPGPALAPSPGPGPAPPCPPGGAVATCCLHSHPLSDLSRDSGGFCVLLGSIPPQVVARASASCWLSARGHPPQLPADLPKASEGESHVAGGGIKISSKWGSWKWHPSFLHESLVKTQCRVPLVLRGDCEGLSTGTRSPGPMTTWAGERRGSCPSAAVLSQE